MKFSDKTNKLLTRALKAMEVETQYEKNAIVFDKASVANDYFIVRLARKEREVFSVLFLTSQNTFITCEDLFEGTINQSPVFPREIVKRALELNAAAIILAHNHPSGKCTPSSADRSITELVIQAASLLDIRVLDHIVVANTETYSFAENGLL